MNKELLIIVYKFNIDGMTHQQVNETIHNFVENNSLKNDIALMDNYIIREIYIPVKNSDSDVQVIYPLSPLSVGVSELIRDINIKMKDNNISDDIKIGWNKLLRELKIRNLETDII